MDYLKSSLCRFAVKTLHTTRASIFPLSSYARTVPPSRNPSVSRSRNPRLAHFTRLTFDGISRTSKHLSSSCSKDLPVLSLRHWYAKIALLLLRRPDPGGPSPELATPIRCLSPPALQLHQPTVRCSRVSTRGFTSSSSHTTSAARIRSNSPSS